jgi:hypothetical protein
MIVIGGECNGVCCCSGGNNYSSNVGLDLKRHVEEQSMGSPSSPGDQDSLQEPDVKRSRHEQPQYDTE